MEATVLSVGKSVVAGALSYAKSAVAEEVALQLGVQRDQAFITDELEMMQAFLMVAHDERDRNRVVKVWVKQVRDVAYDVEDCLQDFAVRLEKLSWWRALRERHRIATQMKELRCRVEDVSQRNLRYHLIKGSASGLATVAQQSSTVSTAAVFGIDEARRSAKSEKAKVNLMQLINGRDSDLRVISVWGTSGDLGHTSIIRAVYENPNISMKFPCRAWVRAVHPFNPKEFVWSLMKQFYITLGVDVLLETEKTGQQLAQEFKEYVNEKSYLIVVTNVSTIEEWDQIKACFTNNRKGSRIIVSAMQVEVASLCAGQESIASELKQLSADQTIYAFHEKGSRDVKYPTKPVFSSNSRSSGTNDSTLSTGEILEDQTMGADRQKTVGKRLGRVRMHAAALEESHLIGREEEKSGIIKLILNHNGQRFQVISVWGMGGIGKTSLVKDVYQSQELSGKFEKRVCAIVMRPFVLEDLIRSLIMQLDAEPSEGKDVVDLSASRKKKITLMELEALVKDLAKILEQKSCLIVLDDISSTAEWDLIMQTIPEIENTSRIIVTTREENIAKHCSAKEENIYQLKVLEDQHAHDLFTRKVFKDIVDLDKQYPQLVEQAELIMRKCNRLPLAIVTIGGFLANQPKTVAVWRKLNEHISAELEMNPELETIRTVLIKSYDGLPYYLKSCFLYLPIFPEDHNVSRRRLVRRWTAEGYSREVRDKSAEEIADSYFLELISRSMILPSQQSIHSRKGIGSCQVHDLMREIGISKSMEEGLVFRLEEGCKLNNQGTIRHLAISSSWEGDQVELESIVDMSRIRSLTLFGKWRPFFISDKMRLLRVLDLEDTVGLVDHHLKHIGKLLHLRYLSLRGCDGIHHLPHSLGNLVQLETLDITSTSITKLPKSIIKLRKLHHLLAGCLGEVDFDTHGNTVEVLCFLTLFSAGSCVACCTPHLLKEFILVDGDVNRRDVCTTGCCTMLPLMANRRSPHSVIVPRGIHNLKVLYTLSIVNIARGKGVLQDIKRLTRLRKLGVTGINRRNSQELCSTLANLSHLESLLLRSTGNPGLSGCLDALSLPPKNLQSLKLCGKLVKLPEWIEGLKNLVKLKLRSSRILEHDAAMQLLGNLPNLVVLRLWTMSFQGQEVRLSFRREAFPSLTVLELGVQDTLKSVDFEEGTAPKLELLQFCNPPSETKAGLLSGLPSLPCLKEFMLLREFMFKIFEEDYKDDFVENLRRQLAENPNRPVLKRE